MPKLIQCKSCGEQIAKSAKSCPHCGAKNKRPFYKKWWFWLIIIVFFIGILPSEDEPSADTDNNSSGQMQTENQDIKKEDEKSSDLIESDPEPEKTSFTIGESVELNNVVVTLIDVYEINGNGFFEPTDGNTFVICEFEIENNTTGDIAVSSMLSFEAYFDGYAANLDITAIALSEKTQLDATVAAGKKIRGVVGYQAPEDWQNVELQFSPSFWSYKKMIFTSSK